MTKEVLITISGLQAQPGDEKPEPVETIVFGQYYYKNGKHYVLYEEQNEHGEEPDKNRVKFCENFLELNRTGMTTTHLLFEKDKKNVSYYRTPYGSLEIGVDARRVRIEEKEELILAKVEYGMELNSQHVADCSLQLMVQPKGSRVTL